MSRHVETSLVGVWCVDALNIDEFRLTLLN
jgi:hypothetical protein